MLSSWRMRKPTIYTSSQDPPTILDLINIPFSLITPILFLYALFRPSAVKPPYRCRLFRCSSLLYLTFFFFSVAAIHGSSQKFVSSNGSPRSKSGTSLSSHLKLSLDRSRSNFGSSSSHPMESRKGRVWDGENELV